METLFGGRSLILRTANGRVVTVGGDPFDQLVFRGWCRAMERHELQNDRRFASHESRREHRDELVCIISDWVAGFDDLDPLERALAKGRLVLGIVRTLRETIDTQWARERGAAVAVSDRGNGAISIPQSPWRFCSLRSGVRGE